MEAPLSELLSLHWWKVILIILAMPVAAIGFRIAIKFDVNIWQKNRQENKQRAEMMKIVENCGHSWNLYPDSIYSECATCLALIQTTILLLGMKLGAPPLIIGRIPYVRLTPGEGRLIATSYRGMKV